MAGRRYAYTFLMLVLWTSFRLGKFQQQCENIPNELRFDCDPEGDASQENCLNRGCCWRKPSISFEAGEVPLDTPYCFYPTNYGYEVVDKQHTQTGYALKLTRRGHLGPYGKDVINLTMEVLFEGENRLHFKVVLKCAVTCTKKSEKLIDQEVKGLWTVHTKIKLHVVV